MRGHDDHLAVTFDAWARHAWPPLVAQLAIATGSLSEAEDCVQEALERAWLRWELISGYDDPTAWARRVAFNLSISRWRRWQRRRVPRHGPERQDSPDAFGRADDRSVLLEAMRQLPAREAQVLTLHYLLDMPIAQIATDLGIPEGTAKTRLHRGRTALKRTLEPKQHDRDHLELPNER